MSETTWESKLKIHFFYVTLYLVSVIILLVTAKWTELPKFTDYLSTAATVTSLVLGLLAIIYAYISNNSLSQTTGVVSEAAHAAQNATGQITSLVSSLDTVATSTEQSNKQLDNILIELQREIDELNKTVSVLNQHSQTVASVLPNIPVELDRLGKRLEDLAQAAPSQTQQLGEATGTTVDPEALSSLLLNGASPSGLLVMYACYLSKNHKKDVDLLALGKDFTSAEYMYGYFIALCSLDLVEYDKTNQKNQAFRVTVCPESFKNAGEFFKSRSNVVDITPEYKQQWLSKLEAIELMFTI